MYMNYRERRDDIHHSGGAYAYTVRFFLHACIMHGMHFVVKMCDWTCFSQTSCICVEGRKIVYIPSKFFCCRPVQTYLKRTQCVTGIFCFDRLQ